MPDAERSKPIRAAVLTVSDRCSAGVCTDASGPAVRQQLRERFAADIAESAVVPDDVEMIRAQIAAWLRHDATIDLVLTTGGTGLGPRDMTPEAVRPLLERYHPGLLELARWRCGQANPLAYLSRGVAGTIGRTLVVTLPGSPRGATETLAAIAELLPHAIELVRGHTDRHT